MNLRASILAGGIGALAFLSGVRPLPAAAGPDPAAIRAAIEKSLPLLTTGARVSMEERARCFTCHNQGLPIMALTTARAHGFSIDEDELQAQLAFTAAFLEKNREGYLAGKGQGGQVDTAGHALWALEHGGREPDATTAAVAEYLLLWQSDMEHWKP